MARYLVTTFERSWGCPEPLRSVIEREVVPLMMTSTVHPPAYFYLCFKLPRMSASDADPA